MYRERNINRRLFWLLVIILSAGVATHAGVKAETFQRQNLSVKTELVVSGSSRSVPALAFIRSLHTDIPAIPRHFDMASYHDARTATALVVNNARFLSRDVFVPYTPVKMIPSRPDDPFSHSSLG